MSEAGQYDLLVIGGGPAGLKAAVQGAKLGKRVGLIEREAGLGGECVYRGTIPSKTLRETALYLLGLKRRSGGVFDGELGADVKVSSLMQRLTVVREQHADYLRRQVDRNGIEQLRGRASFVSPTTLRIDRLDGGSQELTADAIIVATGSRPRRPEQIPVDHEHILDSDSILSLIYLPTTLTVLGSGIIACEFASVFAALGVDVTIVSRSERPIEFLDPELTDAFLDAFEAHGGTFLESVEIESVEWDGFSRVVTRTSAGKVIESEKALCAFGRVASVADLNLEAAGIELTKRGHIPVDDQLRTVVPRVFAAGDVVGPPALATTAMHQGRRATRNALGMFDGPELDSVPVGVYTIPEIACVGETEAQVRERLGDCIVGRANFNEIARGHINGSAEGFLKLVCDGDGRRVLGAQVCGEGATELVHLAQLAMYAELEIDAFLDNVFNFPTMAEAYRVAALAVAEKRLLRMRVAG